MTEDIKNEIIHILQDYNDVMLIAKEVHDLLVNGEVSILEIKILLDDLVQEEKVFCTHVYGISE